MFSRSIEILKQFEEERVPNTIQWEELTKDLAAGQKLLRRMVEEVTRQIRVEAYHRSGSARERTRVHVHNYDQISGSGTGTATATTPAGAAPIATFDVPVPDVAKRIAVACVKQLRSLVIGIPSKVWDDGAPLAGKNKAFDNQIREAQELVDTLQTASSGTSHGTPPSAMVFLRNLDVKHDDELLLKIFVTSSSERAVGVNREGDANVVSSTATHTEDFHIRLVRVGLLTKTQGNFIYARASSGPGGAKSWKPNAAASFEWQYRMPYADNWYEKFYSWLEPGFGIHVASLDMDSALSTEIGVGVNLSLWGGLVRAGYGTNLLIDRDHEYFFVGVDLFDLLQGQRDQDFPIR